MQTEHILGLILLIVLSLALTVYAANYNTAIQSNANVSDTDKAMSNFIPTLMMIFSFVGGGVAVVYILKGKF